MRAKKPRPRGVLWEGESPLDGAPIAAIATSGSGYVNPKTGPLAQVYILRRDLSPVRATETGADLSICGHCPLRRSSTGERSCYVNLGQAPWNIWHAYKDGRYPYLFARTGRRRTVRVDAFVGEGVRWGAYGDPAMLPEEVVRAVNTVAAMHLGYTHQWRYAWAAWAKSAFMASVETEAQEARARALGWGTFRVGRRDGADIGAATLCANVRSGVTCTACGACDGRQASIYVPAHGSRASFVPAERLLRKGRPSLQ